MNNIFLEVKLKNKSSVFALLEMRFGHHPSESWRLMVLKVVCGMLNRSALPRRLYVDAPGLQELLFAVRSCMYAALLEIARNSIQGVFSVSLQMRVTSDLNISRLLLRRKDPGTLAKSSPLISFDSR